MPLAILPRISDSCHNEDDRNCKVQIEEYQVDSINVPPQETGHETEEEEEEYDDFDTENAIVVNDKTNVPHFGSVSVVNSNDVHFGNKTVYKGPVTIKQFVYPNGDVNSETENTYGLVKKIASNEGIVNNGFVGDSKDLECRDSFKEDKPVERGQETNNIARRINKSFKWIKTVPCNRPKETVLFLFIFLISITTISAVVIWRNPSKVIQITNDYKPNKEDDIVPIDYTSDADSLEGKLRIINRLLWLAQPPSGSMSILKLPVSLIIIQHTATVSCVSQAQCIFQTRHIQTFHMESNGWSDIGYNFIIGGDGAVYEGRGWNTEGAHTYGWNNVSIGVGFIGTFNDEIPPAIMLTAFNKLIDQGVQLGHLTKDYKVTGARQFSGTESPGKAFFEVIKSWKHWSDVKNLNLKGSQNISSSS